MHVHCAVIAIITLDRHLRVNSLVVRVVCGSVIHNELYNIAEFLLHMLESFRPMFCSVIRI